MHLDSGGVRVQFRLRSGGRLAGSPCCNPVERIKCWHCIAFFFLRVVSRFLKYMLFMFLCLWEEKTAVTVREDILTFASKYPLFLLFILMRSWVQSHHDLFLSRATWFLLCRNLYRLYAHCCHNMKLNWTTELWSFDILWSSSGLQKWTLPVFHLVISSECFTLFWFWSKSFWSQELYPNCPKIQ